MDALSIVVIMIVIVGEGQGGGVTYPERTEEREASSVVVGGGNAMGLSAGIAIAALDRARILLDEKFGVHSDPRRSGNDDNDSNDNN
jgi:hypothetical protein